MRGRADSVSTQHSLFYFPYAQAGSNCYQSGGLGPLPIVSITSIIVDAPTILPLGACLMTSSVEPAKPNFARHGESLCAPAFASRIPSLDGFRALAIGLVLLSHSIFSLRVRGMPALVFAGWLGGTGVNIFFVLSGFLITFLLLKEWDKTAQIDLRGFYVRRAFRILPPFYLLLLTIFVLQRAHVLRLPTLEIVYSALFVFNYSTGKNTWVAHSWSLSVEEQFYLFWPLILMLFGPIRSRRIALALIAIVPVIRIVTLLVLPENHYLVERMWMLAHTRIDMLMFGCALALFWTSQRFERMAQLFFRMGGMPMSLLVLFLVCPVLSLIWPMNFMSVAGYTMTGFAVAACIYYFVENPETILGRGLNLPLVAHLGVISYSVYLWQQLFLNEKNITISGRLPWSLFCTILIAEFSYWCVERPSLRLRDLMNGRKKLRESTHDSFPAVTSERLRSPIVNG